MSRELARFAVAVVLALPLGGCGAVLREFGLSGKPRVTPSAAPASTLASATEEGRVHLAAGRTGLAVEAFRRALAAGEPIGAAANGMGVAYARLGHYEISRRFFEQAIAVERGNESYQGNLARLTRSEVFAMRHEGDLVTQALGSSAAQALTTSAMAVAQPGKLERLSRGEVRIATLASGALPFGRGQAAVPESFRPLVRISMTAANAGPKAAAGGVVAKDVPASAPASTRKHIAVAAGFRPVIRMEIPAAAPAAGMQRISRGAVRIVSRPAVNTETSVGAARTRLGAADQRYKSRPQ